MRLITIIAATLLVAVSALNAAEKTKKDKKSSGHMKKRVYSLLQ